MMKKVILLIFGFILTIYVINAQTWTQIGQDVDGEAENDLSGYSVCLNSDGNVVAIGAYNNNGNGSASGHVRIYQNNSGTWTQIGSDIDGEKAGDWSGNSVSLSSDGTVVAIGAYHNDGNGSFSGHVRIYQNNSGIWTQIGSDIDGEAAGDWSGFSVSLSSDGSIVAVGAPANDGIGDLAGHVRVFENDAGTWTQIGSDIDGEAAEDWSGYSVSLSSDGSIVAIGARLNDGNGIESGHVRIYENISGTWTQVGDDIDGETAGDNFGVSVNLNSDGSIIAIGAIYNTENGTNSGHVRVFENDAGIWTQRGNDINGEEAGDNCGMSVCLSSDGSIVAVGADNNQGKGFGAGHVRIYQDIAGTWEQIGSDIDGEAENDNSGWSVSISDDGSKISVGAPYNDGNGVNSGHVRIYSSPFVEISDVSKKKSISIYPNPTNGIINLEYADNNIQLIKISDITGKIIFEKTVILHNETIDLSSFESGILIIRIQTNQEIISAKIVKR